MTKIWLQATLRVQYEELTFSQPLNNSNYKCQDRMYYKGTLSVIGAPKSETGIDVGSIL